MEQQAVVLQKLAEEHNGQGSPFLLGLGRHSKQAGDEGDLPVDVSFATPLTCPLRIMFVTSYPCSVHPAVSTEKKPSPGLTSRLMKRWSCSIRLLRYLTCLSSTDSGSIPVALSSAMAFG